MLVFTDSCFLHALQNNVPAETVIHWFAYHGSLRRFSGVTDLGSLRQLGPFDRFFPFGGLRSITRFLDHSDDIGQ